MFMSKTCKSLRPHLKPVISGDRSQIDFMIWCSFQSQFSSFLVKKTSGWCFMLVISQSFVGFHCEGVKPEYCEANCLKNYSHVNFAFIIGKWICHRKAFFWTRKVKMQKWIWGKNSANATPTKTLSFYWHCYLVLSVSCSKLHCSKCHLYSSVFSYKFFCFKMNMDRMKSWNMSPKETSKSG